MSQKALAKVVQLNPSLAARGWVWNVVAYRRSGLLSRYQRTFGRKGEALDWAQWLQRRYRGTWRLQTRTLKRRIR